jgi:hypothetical protein
VFLLNQGRDNFSAQLLERFGIAEKARHADQQVLGESGQLFGIFLQQPQIVGNLVSPVGPQAALDAKLDRGFAIGPQSHVWFGRQLA